MLQAKLLHGVFEINAQTPLPCVVHFVVPDCETLCFTSCQVLVLSYQYETSVQVVNGHAAVFHMAIRNCAFVYSMRAYVHSLICSTCYRLQTRRRKNKRNIRL